MLTCKCFHCVHRLLKRRGYTLVLSLYTQIECYYQLSNARSINCPFGEPTKLPLVCMYTQYKQAYYSAFISILSHAIRSGLLLFFPGHSIGSPRRCDCLERDACELFTTFLAYLYVHSAQRCRFQQVRVNGQSSSWFNACVQARPPNTVSAIRHPARIKVII